ncbi:MAG TPA: C40 family peptidase [Acidimicrobiia bacterium]|nr:C40 family peptidase [Acidimicrobiia bacterium]
MPTSPPATRARRVALVTLVLSLGLGAAACVAPAPPPPTGPAGPPDPHAAVAIAYAEAQVGKPYCYAGTGPTCFDCSGLTMMAWGAAGLTLPHFSGAQYAMFPKVPLSQIQPGDLLFPADPNQHVALYVGNGLMVHATTPGDVVKYATLAPVGITQAVRPT